MTEKTTAEAVSPRKEFRTRPVMLIATSNPKKPKSESHRRFEGYFKIDWSKPQTVQSILDAGTVRMDDIKHDDAHGFIAVGADKIEAAKKAAAEAEAKAIEDAKKLLARVKA